LYQPGSVKTIHPSVIACDDHGYRGHGADTKEIKFASLIGGTSNGEPARSAAGQEKIVK